MERNNRFKLVLGGEGATGKSSLLDRVKYGRFNQSYKLTIGGSVVILDLVVNNVNVRLLCWDSAGQSQFACIRQAFYRGMKGFIIVFDIAWRGSFDAVLNWYYELRNTAPDVPWCLVGNKIDLEAARQVSREEAQNLATELGAISYIETSAKTGIKACTPFNRLTEQLLMQQKTDHLIEITEAIVKS